MLEFKMLDITWFVPSCVKFEITYPSGLVHIVVNTMTLISNTISQMVRFCIRNDMEEQTSIQDITAFDRTVSLEDKCILESITRKHKL